MLLAFCTASPGSLRRPAGPARTASGAMALLSTYLFDACRLSNLVADGRPAWRAARWQPAQYALDSDFCLAALTAAASGAGAGRLASPALPTPATRVSARRPRRPRRARMARRSSGAFPAGCAGQSASLRAPPPLRGAATGAAAVNTAAVYVTTASLCRRSRRRRSPLEAFYAQLQVSGQRIRARPQEPNEDAAGRVHRGPRANVGGHTGATRR